MPSSPCHALPSRETYAAQVEIMPNPPSARRASQASSSSPSDPSGSDWPFVIGASQIRFGTTSPEVSDIGSYSTARSLRQDEAEIARAGTHEAGLALVLVAAVANAELVLAGRDVEPEGPV